METESITLAGFASRAVRATGDSDQPAFLFLHGFSDSADGWRRVQRRLAALGHHSMAVDQPSHGHAASLDPERPVIAQFVEFAAAAAAVADEGRPVIVVGNSLGGAHALLLAQHHPELVCGVVAISPAGFDHPRFFDALDEDSRLGKSLRRMRDDRSDRPSSSERKEPNQIQKIARRTIAGTGMRALAFGRPWRAPSGFIDDWRRQWRDPARRQALQDLVPRVRAEYLAESPFDLPSIGLPVLALWGTDDRLVLVSSRSTLEAGLPDIEFVALPGIGHMPQLEAPGRTTKHLHRFAERVSTEPDMPRGS